MSRQYKTSWPASHLLGGAEYRPSYDTNLAETFRRARRAIELEQRERARREAEERTYVDELAEIAAEQSGERAANDAEVE